MSADRAADHLALARELERRDSEVAARLDLAVTLLGRVDAVRARAGRIRTGLEVIPGDVVQVELAQRDARDREQEARRELVEAEQQLGALQGSRRSGADARAAAERAVRRAAVAATDAAATLARLQERLELLELEQLGLEAEGEGLAVEARDLARALGDVSRLSDSGRAMPGGSLVEIEEWGARVHAALFVVRGGLESERERIVVEANALAAAVLDDHGGGMSVALVRRRLEASLGS